MLRRAASNAYSWWWASHIRTTQSKWLDNNLQEMETRVKAMIKLIEIDADTFAKKAELYFRSRPELVNYVEETYRSYQALADRYDRVSGELHKSNHTIATAFPEQVQLSLQNDDGDGFPKGITGINISRGTSPAPKRTQTHRRISSQMSKDKAQEEIERLQKEILVFQTEKEFFKSSYESSLNKYLDIERRATEMQEEVWSLQETFSTSAVIEDNEARALMAARALISCEDTLVNLQDQQKRSSQVARTEFKRVIDAKKKLSTFTSECGHPHNQKELSDQQDVVTIPASPSTEDNDLILQNGRLELQEIFQKVKRQFESCSEASVVHLAGKVDEFVDKVITLEIAASSQNAQINRMRTEADELHKRLANLEEEKGALIGDFSKLSERLKQVEEVLQTIQRIEKSVHSENGNIHKQLTEACSSLNDFVEKLDAPLSEELVDSSQESKGITSEEDADKPDTLSEPFQGDSGTASKSMDEESLDSFDISNEAQEEEPDGTLGWQQLVLNGLEGKDKILLKDYASILRNYKDTKKQLSEIEKKNREYHLEAMSEMKELKSANATKDDEIRSLRRMLSSLQTKFNTFPLHYVEKSEESSEANTNPSLEDKEIAEIEEYMKHCEDEEPHVSSLEDKFKVEISRVLEESLDFWLRFSTSYHYMQKFQKSFDKAKAELDRLTDAKAQDGLETGSASQSARKHESAALEKKFRDLSTDLQVWLEKNVLLQWELESRFSLLCSIQEEISKITMLNRTDEAHFTPFQAAKFQGEVSNMKQENNKVTKELQAGLDHVRGLQVEVGRALLKLRENIELSIGRSNRAQQNFRSLSVKAGVPLRTFLFGSKPKRASLFSCMGPIMPKPVSDMRPGLFR
ncbi:protein NETWORKED 2A-like [Phragmites australis]|uniref:protein NETWORKED 2A-like n=1 Tax=Phragmites australis TaxID=29695 RepID=UPI002D788C77|nr:protein NETWORKED 2A-like [Phragmites australis]